MNSDYCYGIEMKQAILYIHKERFLNALLRYSEANEAKKKAKELGYSK
jgi:hypothetical protein